MQEAMNSMPDVTKVPKNDEFDARRTTTARSVEFDAGRTDVKKVQKSMPDAPKIQKTYTI
jgi:hypothetical protein